VSALPPGDLPTHASFGYGPNCGSIAGCGYALPYSRVDFGLVTFFYGNFDITHHEYVYVVADHDGRLQLAGEISASPPPIFSVPTPVASAR
jgi:hypothetical protein